MNVKNLVLLASFSVGVCSSQAFDLEKVYLEDVQLGDVVYFRAKSNKKFAVTEGNKEAHQTDGSKISFTLAKKDLESTFASAFVVQHVSHLADSGIVMIVSGLDGAGTYIDKSDNRIKVAYQQFKDDLAPIALELKPVDLEKENGKRFTMTIAGQDTKISSFRGKWPMGVKESSKVRKNNKFTLHVDKDAPRQIVAGAAWGGATFVGAGGSF